MRILAIELSSFTGSVLLADDDQVVGRTELPDDQRSAQSLTPTIKNLISNTGWSIDSLDLICLTNGPGSFTSLRIAVTSAKVLAWSINAEVVAVNTLRAIALRAFAMNPELAEVITAMDAQRKQLFTATYENRQGIAEEIEATSIKDREQFFTDSPVDVTVTGTGLEKIVEQLEEKRPDIRIADEQFWKPRAEDVLALALHDWKSGRREDCYKLAPQYYRQSAAEEKAAAESK